MTSKKRSAQEMHSPIQSPREPGGYPQDVYDAYDRDLRGAGLRGGEGPAVDPDLSADGIQAQPYQQIDRIGRIWQKAIDGIYYQVAGPILNPKQEELFKDQLQAEWLEEKQARQQSLLALQSLVEDHGRFKRVKKSVTTPQAHQPLLQSTLLPASQPTLHSSQQPPTQTSQQAPSQIESQPAGLPLPQSFQQSTASNAQQVSRQQTPAVQQPPNQYSQEQDRELAEILRAAHTKIVETSQRSAAQQPAGQLPHMPLPADLNATAQQCSYAAPNEQVQNQGVSGQGAIRKGESGKGANGPFADAKLPGGKVEDQDSQANIDPALKAPLPNGIEVKCVSCSYSLYLHWLTRIRPGLGSRAYHKAEEALKKSAQIGVAKRVSASAKCAIEMHARAKPVDPDHDPRRNICLSMHLVNPADEHHTIALDWDLAFFHSPVIARHFSHDAPSADYRIAATIEVRLLPTVRWFSHWLYTQTLYPRPLAVDFPVVDEQTLLVDLYLLAESLEIPRLQNLCLRELHRVREESKTLSIEASSLLYTYSPRRCRLRGYFVWQYATRLSADQIVDGDAERYYSPQMMLEWISLLTHMLRDKEDGEKLADFQLARFLVQEKEMIWPFLKGPDTENQLWG
ncbi:hypothetical protein QTJ16_002966 [Diplocarpon rosae]|uniref:BTB domain-containing protein n=1 Tax=Diplocarpon rosae TaxID=946125 RepID=A0AAD9WEF2_9HELO|nr:hypothetical protein QTJ16_002966 [Diplocarpon rosae]